MGMLCVDALRAVLLEVAPGERRRVASRAVTGYGSASMWGDLRRVLVRRPLAADAAAWEAHGWRAAPDVAAAQAEHEAFSLLLEEAGAEVVVSEHDAGNPDAIYTYDPTLVGVAGAVLLLPGEGGPAARARGDRRDARGCGSPGRRSRSSRPRPSRAVTRSGSTSRRCSSGSAIARTPPRWTPSARRSPASR